MHIILSSSGSSIIVENGQFLIVTPDQKRRIHPARISSISIARGARITSDAILLALEHEIDIFFLDQRGEPRARVWSIQYGSIATIRKKQIEFLYSPHVTSWVKDLVIQKIRHQKGVLRTISIRKPDLKTKVQAALNALSDYISKIQALHSEYLHDILPELRGWEGQAARRYFRLIADAIPTYFPTGERTRHPARDPFNAMLNYGYGILYTRVEGALIRAGLDPYVGIYHRDDYNRPALVYDIVELYRHWVDYPLLTLCLDEAIPQECFRYEPDGTCMLEPLGKRIVAQAVIDYLSEIVAIDGVKRSREEHINRYARHLAKQFLKTDEANPWKP